MGGRKKPSISQLEKRMSKSERGKAKKGKEKKFEMTYDAAGELTQTSMDHIIKEIKKMSYITPYQVAIKFGFKISRAKNVLRELETQGIIKAVDKNRRVPIYIAA